MSTPVKPRTADAWGHSPEPMPDLSSYREDAEIVTAMILAGLPEGMLPAMLRIIKQQVAELMKDAEPIIG